MTVVDLAAARREARLDELAALLLRAGLGVDELLTEANMDEHENAGAGAHHATSVRLDRDTLGRLDAVVEALRGGTVARAVGARWGRSTALRVAVEAGLVALLGEAAPAPAGRPPQAVGRPCARCGAPAGAYCAPSCTAHPSSHAPAAEALVEVELDNAGTRYRVTCWRTAGGSIGASWPDAHWAVGDLSPHAPPGVEWLREHGLRAGDAPGVALAIARAWPRLVGGR